MSSQPKQQGGKPDKFQDYVQVAERIGDFYDEYPDGRIITHIVEHDAERGFILIRAEVYRQPDDAQPAATGHAYEMKGDSYVNKTSYIENCETGAVGRALANLNFAAKRGQGERTRPQPIRTDAEKRGKELANVVNKRGDVYHVPDGGSTYQVRQGDGAVTCTCDDYAAHRGADPKHRCAHKWAVIERAKIEGEVNKQAAREQA